MGRSGFPRAVRAGMNGVLAVRYASAGRHRLPARVEGRRQLHAAGKVVAERRIENQAIAAPGTRGFKPGRGGVRRSGRNGACRLGSDPRSSWAKARGSRVRQGAAVADFAPRLRFRDAHGTHGASVSSLLTRQSIDGKAAACCRYRAEPVEEEPEPGADSFPGGPDPPCRRGLPPRTVCADQMAASPAAWVDSHSSSLRYPWPHAATATASSSCNLRHSAKGYRGRARFLPKNHPGKHTWCRGRKRSERRRDCRVDAYAKVAGDQRIVADGAVENGVADHHQLVGPTDRVGTECMLSRGLGCAEPHSGLEPLVLTCDQGYPRNRSPADVRRQSRDVVMRGFFQRLENRIPPRRVRSRCFVIG